MESILTTAANMGGDDMLSGEDGDDLLIGQQGQDTILGGDGDDDIIGGHNVSGGTDDGDRIDGGAQNDVIAGDNATILRRGDTVSPRIRRLSGAAIYNLADGSAQITAQAQSNPTQVASRDIVLLDQSATPAPMTFGNDFIAGGANNDVIFGQLGDDTIQGDGSIDLDVTTTTPSAENPTTDGDDYIEGNGGNDLIFGNLGQDDLIGGSSDLFSLTSADQRPDGSDTIFGGAGTQIARNNAGEVSAERHARDADTIAGDNANIYRLVDAGGFLKFTYDFYSTAIQIIPRAITALDYTPGDDSMSIGGGDLIRAEDGDDVVRGMTGNDVLFGDAQDDDVIGGNGSDRLFGGTGEDGILGDNGLVLTSRNGITEPLNNLTTANNQTRVDLGNVAISETGAYIYITGRLHKAARLLQFDDGGDDTAYGGLGDDFMHGGAGNDAMSGAEAKTAFYTATPQGSDPPLPGHLDSASMAFVFDDFNQNDALARNDGFLLNFNATDAGGNKIDDGTDRLFGDTGSDWLVGGTMNDRIFGGRGDDVLNGDDNLDTNNGLNNDPDVAPFNDADFIFGGLERDVLIGNTGAERVYDWVKTFNTYVFPLLGTVPVPTANEELNSSVTLFLERLGYGEGADALRRPDEPLG